MTTISVTSEFRDEFEAERAAWFRRRFLWYTAVAATLGAGATILRVVAIYVSHDPVTIVQQRSQLWPGLPSLALEIAAFLFVLRNRRLSREQILRLVYWLIIIGGVIAILAVPFIFRVQIAAQQANLTANQRAVADTIMTGATLGPIFIAHFFASLFIPWTPREAVRPLVPLLLCYAVAAVVFGHVFGHASWLATAIYIALSPLVGVPGVTIAWWRHSRFRQRFSNRVLKRTYGELRRELVDARRIHEALFPDPLDTGPVRFHYVYEPMRQIGGDFLFARCVELPGKPEPLLNLVVIDVTGHGISAALTVNRLHGEIEREFGEKPDASPGEVLLGLNAYLHHTLARHSVYATALCLRVDPNTNELLWASAGHPTAFMRTASGRLEQLDSTTLLLGACRAHDFIPNEQRAPFHPGDTLIIYTDGATEARNQDGRMLRTEGMQRLIAGLESQRNGESGLCAGVLQAVDRFRHGPAKDDTLIVEVARPV